MEVVVGEAIDTGTTWIVLVTGAFCVLVEDVEDILSTGTTSSVSVVGACAVDGAEALLIFEDEDETVTFVEVDSLIEDTLLPSTRGSRPATAAF